jgi:hypothetical protein
MMRMVKAGEIEDAKSLATILQAMPLIEQRLHY